MVIGFRVSVSTAALVVSLERLLGTCMRTIRSDKFDRVILTLHLIGCSLG